MPNNHYHNPDIAVERVVNGHAVLNTDQPSRYELRSEEVQDIMTQMPSRIIRQGTAVLFFVMSLLLAGAYYIRFPDIVSTRVLVKPAAGEYLNKKSRGKSTYEAVANLPLELGEKVKTGQQALIKLPMYPFREVGYLEGQVQAISLSYSTDTAYSIKIILKNGLVTSTNKTINGNVPLTGTAEILTSDKSILDRVFETIRAR